MEIIVANNENWEKREIHTKDCPKIRISCERITGLFTVESEKKKEQKKKTNKR